MADKDGNTPLILATSTGGRESLIVLLEKGADMYKINKFNMSALHKAAEQSNVECAQVLLDWGFDVNFKNKLDKSAFYYACWKGDSDIMAWFLSLKNVEVQAIDFSAILEGADND